MCAGHMLLMPVLSSLVPLRRTLRQGEERRRCGVCVYRGERESERGNIISCLLHEMKKATRRRSRGTEDGRAKGRKEWPWPLKAASCIPHFSYIKSRAAYPFFSWEGIKFTLGRWECPFI